MPPSLGAYEQVPHLWPFAALFRALASVGIGPVEARGLALWEAGAVLGNGFPSDDDEQPGLGESGVMERRAAWLAARQRGEFMEPPQPDAPDPRTAELQQRFLTGAGRA